MIGEEEGVVGEKGMRLVERNEVIEEQLGKLMVDTRKERKRKEGKILYLRQSWKFMDRETRYLLTIISYSLSCNQTRRLLTLSNRHKIDFFLLYIRNLLPSILWRTQQL